MKTIIHEYSFYIGKPDQKEAYEALKAKLEDMGLECFETHGGGSHYHGAHLNGVQIELETQYLFNNQWNTAPIPGISESGLRVMDWAQDYPAVISKNLKRGHWLEQTEEMKTARADRMKCGYCGHQENKKKRHDFLRKMP